RFEIGRRRSAFPQLGGADLDDLAWQSADDALMSVLRRLGDFRGDSRFTTWASKFAIVEAGVKVRKHAWRGREILLPARHGPRSPTMRPLRTSTRRREICSRSFARRSTGSSPPGNDKCSWR